MRQDSIKGEALNRDLDPAGDYFKPDNGPSERAFHLVQCGYDMLLTVCGPGFPSLDKRIRKKSEKWMPEASLFRGGQVSTTLANLTARLMEQLDGRLTENDEVRVSKAHHRRLYKALEDFYPIENHKGLIYVCLGEFMTLKKNRLREEVQTGEETGSGVRAGAASRRGPQPGPPPGSDPARMGARLFHQQRDRSTVAVSTRARLRAAPRLSDPDREAGRPRPERVPRAAVGCLAPRDASLHGVRRNGLGSRGRSRRDPCLFEGGRAGLVLPRRRAETPTEDAPANIPTGR